MVSKTRPTGASVQEFLASVPDVRRRADAEAVEAVMREVTGEAAVMWGTSIVGYGALDHAGSRGKPTSWPVIAFAPRKTELVLYLNTELDPGLFERLGPHRRGVGCLYIKRLSEVDQAVLRTLIEHSVELAHR